MNFMSGIRTLEGDDQAQDLRLAIVASRFNESICDRLLRGALGALKQHGVADEDVDVLRVPGAFELPVAIATLLRGGRYDAVIALGVVIRGETPHFDFVAGECARGLSQLSIDFGVPIAFGVLTTDTLEQALERAVETSQPAAKSVADVKQTTKGSNKGAEAALCAIEMANLLRRLGQ